MTISKNIVEELQSIISKNGVQESIKPFYKNEDFTLYNADSLEVML